MINTIGKWWLSGPKYEFSKFLAGSDWSVRAGEALKQYNIFLENKNSLNDVVNAFRGKWYWIPDPLFQTWDTVVPPKTLLASEGNDCDSYAMLFAQAVEDALGWKSWIITYLSDPFWMSHHFTLTKDFDGNFWAIQPLPAKWQPQDLQLVFGPFNSPEESLKFVAEGLYSVKVVWWDMRNSDYSK